MSHQKYLASHCSRCCCCCRQGLKCPRLWAYGAAKYHLNEQFLMSPAQLKCTLTTGKKYFARHSVRNVFFWYISLHTTKSPNPRMFIVIVLLAVIYTVHYCQPIIIFTLFFFVFSVCSALSPSLLLSLHLLLLGWVPWKEAGFRWRAKPPSFTRYADNVDNVGRVQTRTEESILLSCGPATPLCTVLAGQSRGH